MPHTQSRTGVTHIDRKECVALLGNDMVGRLAVLDGHTPVIIPVNYLVDGEDIVFRTDPGMKLDVGPRSPASFEIDGIDRNSRTGWSVVATGRLEEITHFDSRRWHRVHELPLEQWAGGPKEHWMRLVPDRITGRRVGPAR